MEFFNVVKATQKSGKQDAVVWFTAKTEARANLMLDVALEDAGSILRRAKEIVTKKEEPWKSWSNILRNQPGVLGVTAKRCAISQPDSTQVNGQRQSLLTTPTN
ncbi:hypothetical protein BK332_24735 [Escherichia coli]|uniref:hypothetical protein n=1 Tax=Escherichia coli TaxID=562 RepID=UPI000926ECD4|nr:hypothetical protein [Escherichia coli]OJP01384.1 hypothetical protein BK332_24735 [Escherichia coli]